MFKFLHAADIHLDSPLRGLARFESAPVEAIRGATREAFTKLVDLALDEEVAFVLLAGDLYDGDWKDYNTGLFFTQQMGRLNEADIRVFVVAGNHDAESKITKRLSPPPNVAFLSTKEPQTILLDEIEVAIHGQGFSDRHVTDNLAAGFPASIEGSFNIGLLHTSLNGRPGHSDYAPCTRNELIGKGYQYWALGHVHEREEVCDDPWIVFPGCIQGRHARETGVKGCTLVTVENGVVTCALHQELDVMRWTACSIDLNDVESVEKALEMVRGQLKTELAAADGKPLAVRLNLEGACRVNETFRKDPHRWDQQMRAIGVEMSGEDIWIEKVIFKTRGQHDLSEVLSGDSALGGLLENILEVRGHLDGVPGLEDVIATLRQKVPNEVFGDAEEDDELRFDVKDQEFLAEIIDEAKEMLLSNLLTVEDDQ